MLVQYLSGQLSHLAIISAEVTTQLASTMKVISLQTTLYYCQFSHQLRHSYHLHVGYFLIMGSVGNRVYYSASRERNRREMPLVHY